MEPRTLLNLLMENAKPPLTPSSLARALNGSPSQPQIQKFAAGTAKEPRRSTLLPVANYFKVPIDAFYDEDVAEQVARDRELVDQSVKPASDVKEARDELLPGDAIEAAIDMLADVLAGLDNWGRGQAANALYEFAKNPAQAARAVSDLKRAVHDTPSPPTSPRTRPRRRDGETSSAEISEVPPSQNPTNGGPGLTLKLGGGQRQLFEIPIKSLRQVLSNSSADLNESNNYENWTAPNTRKGGSK